MNSKVNTGMAIVVLLLLGVLLVSTTALAYMPRHNAGYENSL